MSNLTNSQVVRNALVGRDAESATGNMWTRHTPEGLRRGGYELGYLRPRLREILLSRERRITQVIYSYRTPIAWKDGDVWIIPAVTYSPTTSSKHQSQLYRLPNDRSIPGDAGMSEYLQVLDGFAIFSRWEGYRSTATWREAVAAGDAR